MDRQLFDKHVTHFTEAEINAVGSKVEDIDKWLFIYLERLRRALDRPMRITSLTGGKHTVNSLHYSGRAVDLKVKGHPNTIIQLALDVGFGGIGLYDTFYHFDTRQDTKLWKRVGTAYHPMIENIY